MVRVDVTWLDLTSTKLHKVIISTGSLNRVSEVFAQTGVGLRVLEARTLSSKTPVLLEGVGNARDLLK